MLSTLLVGFDGSPQSRVALDQAILLGHRFRSRIVVVHVTQADFFGSADAQDEAGHLLTEAADLVRGAGLSVETALRRGSVEEELRAFSRDADLLVVGRIGRLTTDDVLGPDTRELIARSITPLLVCGASTSPMDRCAVAFDGEATSNQALAFAARYAEIAEAQLEVIHVSDDEMSGRAVLARASGALSVSPLRFETHLETGDVHEAVSDAVERLRCNALFVGAHRSEGRWLVPSHTEAILRATDIPVLIHNQPQGTGARISSASHRRTSH
ncbi:MAG: universal stress protein [Gemmatimonadota bacterium]